MIPQRYLLSVLILILTLGLSCAEDAPVVLVSSDRAATIVVDTQWQAQLTPALDDLHRCLGLIATRDLPPVTNQPPASGPRIVITADQSGHPVGNQGFLFKASGQQVTIAAKTPTGASHGIYEILDRLGCRWFFAGDIWEELPQLPTVTLPATTEIITPSFANRHIWYGWGAGSKQSNIDYHNWFRRNRQGSWTGSNIGHAYANIATPAAHFADHPEWFPLIKGKRHPGGQLCLSNKEVQQRAIDYARTAMAIYAERHNGRQILSLSPNDGRGYCQCQPCADWGSTSDQTVRFANIVATAVEDQYPDIPIAMYAYSDNCAPPSIHVHPNIIIYVATAYIKGKYTFDEILEGWGKKASQIGIRAYYDVTILSRDTPRWYVDLFRERIPRYHANNVIGISAESGNNWGPQGINYYIAARLMWDHTADVDALLADFYNHCWGPAEQPMRAYYETTKKRRVTRDGVLALQAASALTQPDTRFQQRVDLMRLYAHFAILYRRHQLAKGGDNILKTAREAMHVSWRLNPVNMVHTYAQYRDKRFWRLGSTFPDPEIKRWKYTDQPPNAAELADATGLDEDTDWANLDEAPKPKLPPFYTHDEINTLLQADLVTMPK